MSVVGFDFGNENCLVAVARQGCIDVVLNDETPAIYQVKRLVGREFSDPELQRDIKSMPFKVTQRPDGYPLIHMGEMRAFTPTQVMGMMFSNLKGIAEKTLTTPVVDCCIGIPVYFTDLQRRAVMEAAKIAGLHPLQLIHETTATALAYGIYKTDLSETKQLNVAFIDVGQVSMQVCIAGFKKGQLKVLSHAFDRSLGRRDFDKAHFAAELKEEYKNDVCQNAKACLWFRSCRVKRPLKKALYDAGLAVEDVHKVEVVGSGSRVPAIIRILTEFFGKEPRRTMNASESVSRGCALECAILSPTFKVREFQVHESFPFSISLAVEGAASDAQYGAAKNQQNIIVFPKGNPIPSVKVVTFYRSGTFSVDVQQYAADVRELQALSKISTYTIGPFQSSKGERAKVKVEVRLNLHGIVSVESATLFEEGEVEVQVSKRES